MKRSNKNKEKKDIHQKNDGKCSFCGIPISVNKMKVAIVNKKFLPLCKSCKEAKGNLSLEQFRGRLQKYFLEKIHSDAKLKILYAIGNLKQIKYNVEFYFEQ